MSVQMLDTILVMKPKRSHLVKSTPDEKAVDTTVDNLYGEPKSDRFDEIIDLLKNDALIKSRSSYNEYIVNEEKKRLLTTLKNIGYYNAKVDFYVENQENNLIELIIKFTI